MFDLESAIRSWRRGLAASPTLEEGYQAELEEHLRDKIEDLVAQGMEPEAAFGEAAAALGRRDKIDAEFFKAHTPRRHGRPSWQAPRFMPALLWNYWKTAVRKARRQMAYSFINIAGLALGMAACLLIAFYIRQELGYDRFHRDADRIVRVTIDAVLGGNPINAPRSPAPLAAHLASSYPEVRASARIVQWDSLPVRLGDRELGPAEMAFADPALFDVFTFPLALGEAPSALSRPYTLVLTKPAAELYFGTDNPVGRFLKIDGRLDFEVTGVLQDIPRNSHLPFDMLCSLETYFSMNPGVRDLWFGNFKYFTYLRLRRPEDRGLLEAKLPGLVEDKMGRALKSLKSVFRFRLQPLTSIHLRSHLQWEYADNGSILYVYLFGAVAVVILAIACINFINLTTARSARRAKEVGLRKVVGASRLDLIGQFLGESIGTSAMALCLALVAAQASLPLVKALTGFDLSAGARLGIWLVPPLLGLALFCGLAAGGYPAFYLSSFQPGQVLKTGSQAGPGSPRFRRILVVGQFTLSVAMMIGTQTIGDQIRYMKSRDLGFRKDQVLVVIPAGGNDRPSPERVKAALREIPGVVSAAVAAFVPGQDQGEQSIDVVVPEGAARSANLLLRRFNADPDFVRTLGMTIVKGRDVSERIPSDAGQAVLLNEEAVRQTGWADPIGKTIRVYGGNDQYETKTVVGVVKDFHYSSLRDAIEPAYITGALGGAGLFVVKLKTDSVARLLADLKDAWRAAFPGGRFDYVFVDEGFRTAYRQEERLNSIFTSFSLLAVAIACLGLFGLASYMAEQRRKEIGIRKVLGASVGSVVGLFAGEYLKLVGLAALIAWPIAFFAMSTWLRGFAYRTGIRPETFLGSAAAALAIAFLTVAYQARRAALADPAASLKCE